MQHKLRRGATVQMKRETGRKARLNNIAAAKVSLATSHLEICVSSRRRRPCCLFFFISFSPAQAVSDIIHTTLGPRSMLKIILDASVWRYVRFPSIPVALHLCLGQKSEDHASTHSNTCIASPNDRSCPHEFEYVNKTSHSVSQVLCSRTTGTRFSARLT